MSDEAINLTLRADRDLTWRGMTSVLKPNVPETLVSGILVGLAVLAAPYAMAAIYDVNPHRIFLLAAIYGFAIHWLYVCVWGARRTRSRLLRLVSQAQEKSGPISATFDSKSVVFEDTSSVQTFKWVTFDGIETIKGGTTLRSGAVVIVVSDRDLPEGMTPQAFRDRLEAWRTAA